MWKLLSRPSPSEIEVTNDAGDVVTLSGPSQSNVDDLYALIARQQEARDLAFKRLSNGKLGFLIIFVGPQGFGSVHVEVPSPGLDSFDALMGLQQVISQQLGMPVTITDWKPLERNLIVGATAQTPAPGPRLVTPN